MGNIYGVDIFIAVVLIVSALLSFFRVFSIDRRFLHYAVFSAVCFELSAQTVAGQYCFIGCRRNYNIDFFNTGLFQSGKESSQKRLKSFGSFSGVHFRSGSRYRYFGTYLFFNDDAGAEISGTVAKRK